MARPMKESSYEKKNRITVRLTDLEFEELTRMAKRKDQTISEYVRDQIFINKEISTDLSTPTIDDVQPLTEEFHKIGSNLNQIAYHLNAGGEVTKGIEKEIKKYMADLRILRDKVIAITGE